MIKKGSPTCRPHTIINSQYINTFTIQLSRYPEWTCTLLHCTRHTSQIRWVFNRSTQAVVYMNSVLTRILPWGVPGTPLLRNKRPVRTLGGKGIAWACTPKWSVMWRYTYLIQHGGRSVCYSIMMHAPIFVILMYVEPMKVKEIKLKTLNLLMSCFLFIWPSQSLGCSRVCLTRRMPLHPTGHIFFFFMHHLRFPCGNPTRPRRGENSVRNQNLITYIKWLAGNSKERPNLWITGRQHWGICFHAVVTSILRDTIG